MFNMHDKEGSVDFQQCLEQAECNSQAYDIIAGEDIEARFPGLKIDSKHKAMYEENGIVLKPEKILEVLRVIRVLLASVFDVITYGGRSIV